MNSLRRIFVVLFTFPAAVANSHLVPIDSTVLAIKERRDHLGEILARYESSRTATLAASIFFNSFSDRGAIGVRVIEKNGKFEAGVVRVGVDQTSEVTKSLSAFHAHAIEAIWHRELLGVRAQPQAILLDSAPTIMMKEVPGRPWLMAQVSYNEKEPNLQTEIADVLIRFVENEQSAEAHFLDLLENKLKQNGKESGKRK